ncbi:hypothetical protein LTS18_004904 [Coniosporium uncinatum]|uniref:Uncharacterized protein n=1 Tax=Coniosporium uncinatum TaxID=93489 RepID=A0ACC3DBA4_9PEZI|nr:hypothetical protein LTS18_004904 [Coniosporium uncinatum]
MGVDEEERLKRAREIIPRPNCENITFYFDTASRESKMKYTQIRYMTQSRQVNVVFAWELYSDLPVRDEGITWRVLAFAEKRILPLQALSSSFFSSPQSVLLKSDAAPTSPETVEVPGKAPKQAKRK